MKFSALAFVLALAATETAAKHHKHRKTITTTTTTTVIPQPTGTCPGPLQFPGCTGDSGSEYNATNGQIFSRRCGLNYPGNDYGCTIATDMDACMEYCTTIDGCVAITWVPSFVASNIQCCPKYATTLPVVNSFECDSADLVVFDNGS